MKNFGRHKRIHAALKERNIEITPADNAPVWFEQEDGGVLTVLSKHIQQEVYDPLVGVVDYGRAICPDYSNASNSLAALGHIYGIELTSIILMEIPEADETDIEEKLFSLLCRTLEVEWEEEKK